MGLRRGREESPSAFIRRAEQTGRLPIPLDKLADAQNLMFYGHAAPYPEETDQARKTFRSLYRALTPWQKVLFHLSRWAGRSSVVR